MAVFLIPRFVMINLVVPYQHDPEGGELIYALRAAEQFMDVSKLCIIGDKPPGLLGYFWIEVPPEYNSIYRDRNIFQKLCKAPFKKFVSLYDDEILLKPFNPVPVSIPWFGFGAYARAENNTKLLIGSKALNYDRHYPFTFNTTWLNELDAYDWNKQYAYCVKSLYADNYSVQGTPGVDCKVRYVPVKDKWQEWDCVSTSPMAWRYIKKEIETMFPNKSRWEV